MTPTAEPPTQAASLSAPSLTVPRGIAGLVLASLIALPITSAASALLVVIAAVWMLIWRRKHAAPPLPVMPRLGYAILAAVGLSVAFSVNPGLSWVGLLITGGYLLVIWVMAGALDTSERLWQAQRFIFWGAVGWAALGIVVSLAKFHWTFNSGGILISLGTYDHRANSIFMHPNNLSEYLLLAMGVGLALRTREGFGRRMRYNVGLVIILLCQVLTQTRSGWIATAVALLLAGLIVDRRLLLKAAVGAGACLLLFYQMLWSRILTLVDMNFGSNLNRMRVWNSAQQMIAERPIFGFGPGSWTQVYPQFRDPLEWENLQTAHSFYLHVWAEYGVIVLALLLVLGLGLPLLTLRETRKRPEWWAPTMVMACAVIGYLVMGFFEFLFSEGRNSIIFFVVLGMFASIRRLAPETEPPGASAGRGR